MNQLAQINKLLDVSLQLGLTIHIDPYFRNKSEEQVLSWMFDQYDQCGFPIKKVGSAWVIDQEKFFEKHGK